MQFIIETTCVTNRFTVGVPTPQSRSCRFAISTRRSFTSCWGLLKTLHLNQWMPMNAHWKQPANIYIAEIWHESSLKNAWMQHECNVNAIKMLMNADDDRMHVNAYECRSYQSSLWFDEWPVLPIHFVIKATGIAQIMTIAIPPPKGRGRRTTVDTFTPFCNRQKQTAELKKNQ